MILACRIVTDRYHHTVIYEAVIPQTPQQETKNFSTPIKPEHPPSLLLLSTLLLLPLHFTSKNACHITPLLHLQREDHPRIRGRRRLRWRSHLRAQLRAQLLRRGSCRPRIQKRIRAFCVDREATAVARSLGPAHGDAEARFAIAVATGIAAAKPTWRKVGTRLGDRLGLGDVDG
jgi:hypothetical protein